MQARPLAPLFPTRPSTTPSQHSCTIDFQNYNIKPRERRKKHGTWSAKEGGHAQASCNCCCSLQRRRPRKRCCIVDRQLAHIRPVLQPAPLLRSSSQSRGGQAAAYGRRGALRYLCRTGRLVLEPWRCRGRCAAAARQADITAAIRQADITAAIQDSTATLYLWRPVLEAGAADDVLGGQGAPDVGVVAVVAVVTHHKHVPAGAGCVLGGTGGARGVLSGIDGDSDMCGGSAGAFPMRLCTSSPVAWLAGPLAGQLCSWGSHPRGTTSCGIS